MMLISIPVLIVLMNHFVYDTQMWEIVAGAAVAIDGVISER